MPPRAFQPGFRLSWLDGVLLMVGSMVCVLLASSNPAAAFVVAFVVAHFFLFCNLFRISRPLELIWAGLFTVMAGATIMSGRPGWGITTAVSLGLTVVVVLIEMRRPSYHGVGWRRINPGLEAWWESQASGELHDARTPTRQA